MGELNMAYDAISEIKEDMLMIYDRNFCSYKMAALHMWQEKERKFVIRAREEHKVIKEFLQSGQHSSYVQLRPGAQAIEGLKERIYY